MAPIILLVLGLNVLNLVQYVSALGAYGVVYDFAAGIQGDGKPGCSVFAKDKLCKLIKQELVLTEMEPFLLFLQKFCIIGFYPQEQATLLIDVTFFMWRK